LKTKEYDEAFEITVPFKVGKAKRGAIVIRSQEQDLFNLSSDELKKLVQGVVWRDEHFDGMALKEIAKREGCSEGLCRKGGFPEF
jgi:hypothetical protein